MRAARLCLLCSIVPLLAASVRAQTAPNGLAVDANGRIPRGARFFIDPIEGGYDIYLAAAMQQKQVPIVIVTDKSRAEFELSGVTESDKAGWAKILFWGNASSAEQASIKVVNLKTGTVVFGYNVNKASSYRGKQSSAEACAKHLREKIEKAQ